MQYKINFISLFFGLSLLLATAQAMAGLPGESIVLDPDTGDYTLTYWDSDDPDARLRHAIFVPATKIDPGVQSVFKLIGKNDVVYTYCVTNGKKSKQPLDMMLFDPISDILSSTPLPKHDREININNIEQIIAVGMSALNTPENWTGRTTTSRVGGLRIGWSYSGDGGVVSGKTQAGFGFSSKDIPGIVMAQLSGYAPVAMFPGEGPTGELAKEFELIEQHDFVTRPAAVPAIAVPTPFNAAVLIDRIQAQTHTWIGMKLLDATFSSQLDRYLAAAADAYRHNQPKAGKEHIQTLRNMLKKEHEDADKDDEKEDGKHEGENDDKNKRILIDRLAARVLDFDLKYVLKRMGND